jgi:PAS domain-containing protein
MVIRRALNHKELREELAEAKKALQHSQSLYRALEDNPTYGIYRCDGEGKLLDLNQTLVTMLGYASKEQLLAANQESEIIPNFRDDSLSVCDLLAKDIEEPPLSVSVGVAGYPSDAETIGTLLYAADRALHAMKAKRPGSRLSAHSPYSFSGDSNAEFHENRE